MTTTTNQTISFDERTLRIVALVGMIALLLPAAAPVATDESPGYYLATQYLSADSSPTIVAGGAYAHESASATRIVYGGAPLATGGAILAFGGATVIG